jgi:hypothetical protein
MSHDTSEQLYTRQEVAQLLDSILPRGEVDVAVFRGDGTVETKTLRNVVTRYGLNRMANRAVQATGTTPYFVIGVGTQTAAHSLDSTQAGLGEVLRKQSAFTGANAQSREWLFLTCTIGGASDSVTSVALDSCGITDFINSYANPASNTFGNLLNGLGVTLANSDILNLTVRIRIGSHDLGHST